MASNKSTDVNYASSNAENQSEDSIPIDATSTDGEAQIPDSNPEQRDNEDVKGTAVPFTPPESTATTQPNASKDGTQIDLNERKKAVLDEVRRATEALNLCARMIRQNIDAIRPNPTPDKPSANEAQLCIGPQSLTTPHQYDHLSDQMCDQIRQYAHQIASTDRSSEEDTEPAKCNENRSMVTPSSTHVVMVPKRPKRHLKQTNPKLCRFCSRYFKTDNLRLNHEEICFYGKKYEGKDANGQQA